MIISMGEISKWNYWIKGDKTIEAFDAFWEISSKNTVLVYTKNNSILLLNSSHPHEILNCSVKKNTNTIAVNKQKFLLLFLYLILYFNINFNNDIIIFVKMCSMIFLFSNKNFKFHHSIMMIVKFLLSTILDISQWIERYKDK